jgi:hypothetical protein
VKTARDERQQNGSRQQQEDKLERADSGHRGSPRVNAAGRAVSGESRPRRLAASVADRAFLLTP